MNPSPASTPRDILFALLFFALAWSGGAFATADGPDFYAVSGVSADDSLNLRAEPSASAEKIGAIPHDARGLENLGCRGGVSMEKWQAMAPKQREEAAKRR